MLLVFPSFPAGAVLIFAAFCAVVAGTPRMPIQLALTGVMLAVNAWNAANFPAWYAHEQNPALAGTPNPNFLLVVPSGPARATTTDVGYQLCALAFYACIAYLTHGHIAQFVSLTAQTEVSAKLAKEVASAMRRYDTGRMRGTLDAYKAHPQRDAELHETFAFLLDDLESYRPHLPSWVLPDGDAHDAEEEMKAEDARSDHTVNSLHSLRSARQSARGPRDETSDTSGTTGGETGETPAIVSAQPPGPSMPPAQRHAWGLRPKIALAGVRFVLPDAADATVQAFAERVHRLARETHAVVHSFVSSGLLVSWGAATPVARPELNALRFLLRLKSAVDNGGLNGSTGLASSGGFGLVAPQHHSSGSFGGVTPPPATRAFLAGAASCGPATVRLAGGSQQALVVEAPAWACRLDRLVAYATRHGTVCCDSAAAADVVEVVTQRVGAFRAPPALGDPTSHAATSEDTAPPVEVSELVEEAGEHAGEDEEWMYALQRMETSAEAATAEAQVSDALKKALRGDFGTALKQLEALPPEHVEQHRTVRGLRAAVERCCQRPACSVDDFLATLGER